MNYPEIIAIHQRQKEFFATGSSRSVEFRIQALKDLKQAILDFQPQLLDALWKDLHKSPEEAYLTEIGIVQSELDNHIRHLRKWTKPKRVSSPLTLFPSSSYILTEPLGISLIVAPWNYPFQLLINPLIGSISAGNCAILKPSPDAKHFSAVISELIKSIFPVEYITTIEGEREVNTALFALPFDFIFFTGSPSLGKVVMQAAAQHLTPVVLELGGKSPCIVHSDAHIDHSAKRIIWGKLMNAGQTCIAPDYLFVHSSVKERLLKRMDEYITEFYGTDPQSSRFYPRIVSNRAMERLSALIGKDKIYRGGKTDTGDKYIEPTILINITENDPIMQDEIFGPILPVMEYNDMNEAINYINRKEKPLALYFFGSSSAGEKVLAATSSGGACINDTLVHIGNHKLPFGGVGNSGIGKYHGKSSFEVFSNQRSIVKSPVWIDFPFRYIPYKYMSLVKRIL